VSPASIRFVKHLEPDQVPWMGVWVPSRDSVGRDFPLAVSLPLPPELGALPPSCLPSALTRFADEAEGMLRTLSGGSTESARGACAELVSVHASELPHAWGRCMSRAESVSLREFASVVFEPEEPEQMYYALGALRSAGQRRPMPSLSFPIVDAEDAFVWLELLQAASPGANPDLFWTTGPRAQLLASTSADAAVFGPIWAEQGSVPSVWPVSTQQPDAVVQARAMASAAERALFESGEPLARGLPNAGGRA